MKVAGMNYRLGLTLLLKTFAAYDYAAIFCLNTLNYVSGYDVAA